MDEISTLLSRNFGIQPVGKSAPMSAAKPSPPPPATFSHQPPSWNQSKSHDGSPLWGDQIDDIFGGGGGRSNPTYARSVSSPSPSLDSIFDGFSAEPPAPAPPTTNLFDDVFNGPPPTANFDELFPTSPMQQPADDYLDHLGSLGRTAPPKPDGMIPGFGGGIKQQEDDIWLTAFTAPASSGPKIAPPPVQPASTRGDDVWLTAFDVPVPTGPKFAPAPKRSQPQGGTAEERTRQRIADALESKIERDMEAQREEDERRRIADELDFQIRGWAAGKEGNLRALLSKLHEVLWPECGWKEVGIANLMTSASVKKVYRDAMLCLHPDKVQQKGASLRQKCIAGKVFDLLKEAWNKFNAEEMQRG